MTRKTGKLRKKSDKATDKTEGLTAKPDSEMQKETQKETVDGATACVPEVSPGQQASEQQQQQQQQQAIEQQQQQQPQQQQAIEQQQEQQPQQQHQSSPKEDPVLSEHEQKSTEEPDPCDDVSDRGAGLPETIRQKLQDQLEKIQQDIQAQQRQQAQQKHRGRSGSRRRNPLQFSNTTCVHQPEAYPAYEPSPPPNTPNIVPNSTPQERQPKAFFPSYVIDDFPYPGYRMPPSHKQQSGAHSTPNTGSCPGHAPDNQQLPRDRSENSGHFPTPRQTSAFTGPRPPYRPNYHRTDPVSLQRARAYLQFLPLMMRSSTPLDIEYLSPPSPRRPKPAPRPAVPGPAPTCNLTASTQAAQIRDKPSTCSRSMNTSPIDPSELEMYVLLTEEGGTTLRSVDSLGDQLQSVSLEEQVPATSHDPTPPSSCLSSSACPGATVFPPESTSVNTSSVVYAMSKHNAQTTPASTSLVITKRPPCPPCPNSGDVELVDGSSPTDKMPTTSSLTSPSATLGAEAFPRESDFVPNLLLDENAERCEALTGPKYTEMTTRNCRPSGDILSRLNDLPSDVCQDVERLRQCGENIESIVNVQNDLIQATQSLVENMPPTMETTNVPNSEIRAMASSLNNIVQKYGEECGESGNTPRKEEQADHRVLPPGAYFMQIVENSKNAKRPSSDLSDSHTSTSSLAPSGQEDSRDASKPETELQPFLGDSSVRPKTKSPHKKTQSQDMNSECEKEESSSSPADIAKTSTKEQCMCIFPEPPLGLSKKTKRQSGASKDTPSSRSRKSALPISPSASTASTSQQNEPALFTQQDIVKQEKLWCASCKKRYRWPHVLDCSHIFCFPCLRRMHQRRLQKKKVTKEIRCCNCKTVTKLPDEDLYSLLVDLPRCKLMCEELHSPFLCTTCPSENEAIIYCKTCKTYLCAECELRHEIVAHLESHVIVKNLKVAFVDGDLYHMCSKHPLEKINLFCVTCKEAVCEICSNAPDGHKGHEIKNEECRALIDEMRSSTVEQVHNVLTARDNLRGMMRHLRTIKQNMDSEHRLTLRKINDFCNWVNQKIEEKSREAKRAINTLYEISEKVIKGLDEMLDEQNRDLRVVLDYYSRQLSYGTPASILVSLPLLKQGLRRIHDTLLAIDLVKFFVLDIHFLPSYPDANEFLQGIFDGIRVRTNLSLDSLANSPLAERLQEDDIARVPYGISIWASLDERQRFQESSGEARAASSVSESESDCFEDFNYPRVTFTFTAVFGSFGRGQYEFAEPSGVMYLEDGSIAVCDTSNHRILIYDTNRTFVRMIGQPSNIPPLSDNDEIQDSEGNRVFARTFGKLYYPFRIAQCPNTSNIVVVERPPSLCIQVFTMNGDFIRCFGNDFLRYPRGITVDENGVILVVEARIMRVLMFSQEGRLLKAAYFSGSMDFPNDIAASHGSIYISDNRAHCVHVFDYNFKRIRTIGNESVTYYPVGVSVNFLGQVVVSDNHNTFNVSIFDTDGRYLYGFKSRAKYANCYNVALNRRYLTMAITTRDCQVLTFNYAPRPAQTSQASGSSAAGSVPS